MRSCFRCCRQAGKSGLFAALDSDNFDNRCPRCTVPRRVWPRAGWVRKSCLRHCRAKAGRSFACLCNQLGFGRAVCPLRRCTARLHIRCRLDMALPARPDFCLHHSRRQAQWADLAAARSVELPGYKKRPPKNLDWPPCTGKKAATRLQSSKASARFLSLDSSSLDLRRVTRYLCVRLYSLRSR